MPLSSSKSQDDEKLKLLFLLVIQVATQECEQHEQFGGILENVIEGL